MSILGFLFGRRKRQAADPTPAIVQKGKREPIHSFDVLLAGVELENQDGSMRQAIIGRTEIGAETILVAQMGALKLLAVFLAETGEQLGYVPREPSAKLIKEAKGYDYGSRVAEIREPEPETGIRNVVLTVDVYEKA